MIGERRRRRVEEAGVLDLVVRAAVVDGVAGQQLAHHLDRFLQHLPAHSRAAATAVAGDVLVQRLTGADAEEEPPVEQQRRGGRGLRDHRGMDAHDRARHAHADLDALGRRRDGRRAPPHERAVALRGHPRVVVVGDRDEVEAELLGAAGVGDAASAGRAPRSTACTRTTSWWLLLLKKGSVLPIARTESTLSKRRDAACLRRAVSPPPPFAFPTFMPSMGTPSTGKQLPAHRATASNHVGALASARP